MNAELDWPGAEKLFASFEIDTIIHDKQADEESRMMAHGYANPAGISSKGVLNSAKWRQAEIPSANGYGSAKGIARVFDALANGGERNDHRIISKALLKEAYACQCEGEDRILKRDMRWGLGFQLSHPNRPFGPNPNSYGHYGNGGSVGMADPDTRVAFGYVMNRIVRSWGSPQNKALIEAIYACL